MKYRLFLAFLGFSIATPAGATSLPPSVNFGLHLARLDTSLRNGQQDITTTVKQIGIASIDLSQENLQPGLAIGYAYVSDSDQAVTAGMELQGFFLAPSLRGALFDSRLLSGTLTATYLYQRVKDSNADRSVTMEWQQPQLDLDVNCHVSRQINLLLGAQYGRADVDETVTGDVEQTLTLKTGPTLGYRAGVEIELGGEGQVGMYLYRAISDGVELYFQRQF
ncbi:MAG: hypothetical protein P8164_06180 [Gammaproteobacteria bacterium]|jgi:hypothetical protein